MPHAECVDSRTSTIEMADGGDDHQRALPRIGLVFSADRALGDEPVRQLAREPLRRLRFAVGSLGPAFGHGDSLMG